MNDLYGTTHPGTQRKRNEDHYLIARLQLAPGVIVQDTSVELSGREFSEGAHADVIIVADGMGGLGSGEQASSVAIESTFRFLCDRARGNPQLAAGQREIPSAVASVSPASAPTPASLNNMLGAAVEHGNRRVLAEAERPEVSAEMGTTLTLAVVAGADLYLAHVGDSRAYLIRNRATYQLTHDHTIAEKLAHRGIAVSGTWEDTLWNALGAADPSVEPELRRVRLARSDRVLLCSDGLTKHLDDAEIASFLWGAKSAEDAAEALVAEAIRRGGVDNITVAIDIIAPDASSLSKAHPRSFSVAV